MKLSERCKELGADSLKSVMADTGLSYDRLNTLHSEYPLALTAMVTGLTYRDRIEELATLIQGMR